MSEHTKEPWMATMSKYGVNGRHSIVVAIGETGSSRSLLIHAEDCNGNDRANARRIVDCVNFCTGMKSENMRGQNAHDLILGYSNDMREAAERGLALVKQRDELLHELKNLMDRDLFRTNKSVGEWQPIETAPKDGTPVDLWCHTQDKKMHFRLTEIWFDVDDNCWSCGVPDDYITHWMPLPLPPE